MKAQYHATTLTETYVTVLLPLALHRTFTYYVPEEWIAQAAFGKRAEIPFGRSKLYAGLIIDIHNNPPQGYKVKPILSVVDTDPIIQPDQILFWQWIAGYYACTLGEVMAAALPSGFKLASETRLTISPVFDLDPKLLNAKEYIVAEALSNNNELSVDDIQKLLGQKTVYPLINQLLEKKILFLKEELKEKYAAKKIDCIRLQEPYLSQPDLLQEAFEKLSRSTRQVEALMAYIQLLKERKTVRKTDVYQKANVDSTVIKAMVKKGVFEVYKKEVSRIAAYEGVVADVPELSDQQVRALAEIKTAFAEKNVVLLHGVTGSGKTRIYIDLIQKAMHRGEQVLYLLPEIALTTQLTGRLQKIFGDDVVVFHSRLSNNERVEIWKTVLHGAKIIMAARSGLFMPFQNLKCIIVDEEHDPSYKQNDPAPRYNARDAAIWLAGQNEAKVLLGTATPSIESYHNALSGKYGFVEMHERFGGVQLPEMVVVDKRDELKKRRMQTHFTSVLLEELTSALARGKQAILFQNRRGYAPSIHCPTCNWHQGCAHCDVSLTYHKYTNSMRCHYCGYETPVPTQCGECGSGVIQLRGYGTEKIEDEIKIYLPEARTARMDYDTVRKKHAYAMLINDFEERRIDILVGTQMVTKGLDFDNVGIVGVLSSDQFFQYPDFRASERSFQLITQVAGRAGRKKKRGKVIIQAFNTTHPTLLEILDGNYSKFYHREIGEREEFFYPPYHRLINVLLKHKKPHTVNEAMKIYYNAIMPAIGRYVIGPAVPPIPRIRDQYLLHLMVKLPRNTGLMKKAKDVLINAIDTMQSAKGCSGVRVNIDVDPY